jgi:hypothetical protein
MRVGRIASARQRPAANRQRRGAADVEVAVDFELTVWIGEPGVRCDSEIGQDPDEPGLGDGARSDDEERRVHAGLHDAA